MPHKVFRGEAEFIGEVGVELEGDHLYFTINTQAFRIPLKVFDDMVQFVDNNRPKS